MEIGWFKCPFCEGEFELFVVKDSRQYIPYNYNCVFCGAKIETEVATQY